MPKPAATDQGGSSTYDPSGLIGDIMNMEPGEAPPRATPDPAQETRREPAPNPAPNPAPTPDPVDPGVPDSLVPDGVLPSKVPATPTPPPTPADPADVDEPEEVRNGSSKAKNAWTQVKSENKSLKSKVKELEAKIAGADATKPPEMQKMLEMQQQIQQYEDQIGRLDITQSKSFKIRFDVPAERTFARGVALIQKHSGLSPEDAKGIMKQLVDSAGDANTMQNLISDQPVPVQGALYNLVSDYEQLSKDKEEALASWRQTKLALEENSSRDSEVQLAQNIEHDTQAAVQRALDEGNWMYTNTGGKNPTWDATVTKRIDTVKGILKTATNEELVKWVVEGLTAKDLRAMVATERERSQGLLSQLQQRTGMRPGVRAGAPGQPPAAPKASEAQSADSLISTLFA